MAREAESDTASVSAIFDRRRAGILLHPTSLPEGAGNGDLGADAYRFVDLLADCGVGVWQTLPLGPIDATGSPYQSASVYAGDARLISLERLEKDGWLSSHVSWDSCSDADAYRNSRLQEARKTFLQDAGGEVRDEYMAFIGEHAAWLNEYALFEAVKASLGGLPWWQWPSALRLRESNALAHARESLADAIEQRCFEQFLFHRQWASLKRYANDKDIQMFGDVPLFVAHDSVEVWVEPEFFCLDAEGCPTVVAGVPPDYFSDTGQRWGNPLYDWNRMREDNFEWWRSRIRVLEERFDLIRVDHFRGLAAYWEIPAHEENAINGRWVEAPGAALLQALAQSFGPLPLVAEDLGYLTPDVHALRDQFHLPGMAVLQFAFDGGPDNPHLPHNHAPNSVVYTGTHDNDTTAGWFEAAPQDTRTRVCEYLTIAPDDMPWALVGAALDSVAMLAVVPLQDILGLGSEHRMNTPGVRDGNWRWRFNWEQLRPCLTKRLTRHIKLCGRSARNDG